MKVKEIKQIAKKYNEKVTIKDGMVTGEVLRNIDFLIDIENNNINYDLVQDNNELKMFIF